MLLFFYHAGFTDVNLSQVSIRNSLFSQVSIETALVTKSVFRLCEFDRVSLNGADFFRTALENCKAQGSLKEI